MKDLSIKIVSGNNKALMAILSESADVMRALPKGSFIFPGLCDVHVHFREPGFSYKETILSGSMAAAKGGYTDVCTMPNLNPVPDSVSSLKVQLDIIEKDAVIGVHPYGALTIGEKGEALSDINGMADKIVALSDDGRGLQSDSMMKAAMSLAKEKGLLIAAHCEDNSLLKGGYIHDGEYAAKHGHLGICSKSEYAQIERDLNLVLKTGCKYHVCHISCAESVDLIRQAKKSGLDVTCETAPHYLVLNDSMLKEDGRFKMNPPIRSESDRAALIEGIIDGTIDMIATDHAPHSAEEKSKGLRGSAFGITGLETAFSVLHTHLVRPGIISIEKLVDLMCYNPRKRFNLPLSGFSAWNLEKEITIKGESFISGGKHTPFEGMKVFGENLLTIYNGKTVYKA
ncbi:MAG: dihydroorotase [Clostridia bacterium]|nr:dihydroorotase [Clostridia bacterium]